MAFVPGSVDPANTETHFHLQNLLPRQSAPLDRLWAKHCPSRVYPMFLRSTPKSNAEKDVLWEPLVAVSKKNRALPVSPPPRRVSYRTARQEIVFHQFLQ